MRTFVPAGPGDGVPAGWGVRHAARLAFPGSAAPAADPGHAERLRVYLTDMLRPCGLALDAELLGPGAQSYGEMAEALIRVAVPPGEQVDLLVLAHRVPDITPGRATATWLSHVCPGRPLAFAVTDPSPAAAFTALRLTRAYAAGAGLTRALLLVLEQPSLPYTPAVSPPLPDAAYGVALLLGPPTPGERPPVTLDLTPTDLAAATAGAPGTVTAILGPSVRTGSAGPSRVRIASPARPTTGLWWELTEELTALAKSPPTTPHRLILADTQSPPPTASAGGRAVGASSGPAARPASPRPRVGSGGVVVAVFDGAGVARRIGLEAAGRQR